MNIPWKLMVVGQKAYFQRQFPVSLRECISCVIHDEQKKNVMKFIFQCMVSSFNPFETYELLKLDHFPTNRVDN